jgi:predicted nucleotidyltransferase
MGQVFTWEAIRAGKIPKRENFHTVAKYLQNTLATEPSVVSALLFGSVVRGDFNVRSDIDVVVIYETEREKEAMVAMHHINQRAQDLHVPINFTPCDTLLAQTRLHHLGSSFMRHLQASIDAGGLIKGDLVSMLAPTVTPEDEIESYIKMKMYNMQESMAQMTSFSEERLVSFYKKALEASTHVARKMLIYEGTLVGDSKKQVQERYWETMPPELAHLFDGLVGHDRFYTELLEAQLQNPCERVYNRGLRELMVDNCLPQTLRFLRLNIIRLHGAR